MECSRFLNISYYLFFPLNIPFSVKDLMRGMGGTDGNWEGIEITGEDWQGLGWAERGLGRDQEWTGGIGKDWKGTERDWEVVRETGRDGKGTGWH